MSGAEVISLISAIVGIIDASVKVYGAVSDASGLPASFRDAAARLPLVKDSLEAARSGLAVEDAPSETYQAIVSCLEHCQAKAEQLNGIFQDALPAKDASVAQRVLKGVKAVSKQGQVRSLVKAINEDLQALTANHAIKAATRAQMRDILAAVSMEGAGRGKKGAPMSMYNTGSGAQVNHSGQGDQNISGSQVNGVFHGPINFSNTDRDT